MLVEHGHSISDYVPWVLMCVVSMIFGGVLVWVSYRHFELKQKRINDIFHDQPS
jgi:hypothetical protein